GPSDTPLCYLCTCEQCGNILINGACLKCNSEDGNSFIHDPNPESFNEVQSIFNLPLQSHYNIYLCQIFESNSHYGYECSQRVPLIYEPEPCYNQSFGDNTYLHDSPSIDSLLDEFADELILLKSIPPGIDETNCDPEEEIHLIEKLLYNNSSSRLPKEFISENFDAEIESFSPSPIPVEDSDSLMEEIYLPLTPDDLMPPGIKEDDYDSERDMLIFEGLLSNNSFSLPKNESFHFDIPSSPRPHAKPPSDDEIKPNSGILIVKMVGDISEHDVPMPKLLPTQPTLHSNQEKSPHLLSHQGLKAFQLPSERPMTIYGGSIHILDKQLPATEIVLKASASNAAKRIPPICVFILCSTRELASQIAAEANVLLKYHEGIGVQTFVGGTQFKVDQQRLETSMSDYYSNSRLGVPKGHGENCRLFTSSKEIKDLSIHKSASPHLDPDMKVKVEKSKVKIDPSVKEAAYHAWLGYYNLVRDIGKR
nr:probable DEAD-box ATP-dependent RNA helicase 48 [Tanacetum cinerariifolium]